MSKLDPNQKRLLDLKRQLYGKEPKSRIQVKSGPDSMEVKSNISSFEFSKTASGSLLKPSHDSENTQNLKIDLTKIFFLSSSAIIIQFLLYIAVKNNLINLNF